MILKYQYAFPLALSATIVACSVSSKKQLSTESEAQESPGALQANSSERLLPASTPEEFQEPEVIWLGQTHMFPVDPDSFGAQELALHEDRLRAMRSESGGRSAGFLHLVGGRDALLKFDISVNSEWAEKDLEVCLLDEDGEVVWTETLIYAENMVCEPHAADAVTSHPEYVNHNSTAGCELTIPGQHLSGESVRLLVGLDDGAHQRSFEISVGAPNKLEVLNFHTNLFEPLLTPSHLQGLESSPHLLAEMEQKLPIVDLETQIVEQLFARAVAKPRLINDRRVPPLAASSNIQFRSHTWLTSGSGGVNSFYTQLEQEASVERTVSLVRAGGGIARNVVGLSTSASSEQFGHLHNNHDSFEGAAACVSPNQNSTWLRQCSRHLNEALLGRNWDGVSLEPDHNDYFYPWLGEMYSRSGPHEADDVAHMGPSWMYTPDDELFNERFVQPYDEVDGLGQYLQGAVTRAQVPRGNHSSRLYSDYETAVIQAKMESKVAWNEATESWGHWGTDSYWLPTSSRPGVELPLGRDDVFEDYSDWIPPEYSLRVKANGIYEDTYTILVSASVGSPSANLIYEPIGPYEAGLLKPVDALDSEEVEWARENFCPDYGCDFAILTKDQDNRDNVFLLPLSSYAGSRADGAPLIEGLGAEHVAINLPFKPEEATLLYRNMNGQTPASLDLDHYQPLVDYPYDLIADGSPSVCHYGETWLGGLSGVVDVNDPNENGCTPLDIYASDSDNDCGIYGRACLDGSSCETGSGPPLAPQCECPDGSESYCEDVGCLDLSADSANCGACGNVCEDGETCQDGTCVDESCAPPSEWCDEICVDPASDPNNCGACGNVCGGDQTCDDGVCLDICEPDESYCDGTCVNTSTDPNNCGACGNACEFGCDDGSCACGPEEIECDGACVDRWDESHCGTCDTVCAHDQSCSTITSGGEPTCMLKGVCDDDNYFCYNDTSEPGLNWVLTMGISGKRACGGGGGLCAYLGYEEQESSPSVVANRIQSVEEMSVLVGAITQNRSGGPLECTVPREDLQCNSRVPAYTVSRVSGDGVAENVRECFLPGLFGRTLESIAPWSNTTGPGTASECVPEGSDVSVATPRQLCPCGEPIDSP